MIEQGVIQLLLGTPAAAGARPNGKTRAYYQTALGQQVGASVFPGKAPQAMAYPYLVVAKEGAQHVKALQGSAGFAFTQVRVEIYHPTYATAEAIAENCRLLLDGYRGGLGNGMSCQGIFQDSDANNWQQPVHSDEQGIAAVEIHLKVAATET